jgi:hypothetical protein
MNDWVPSFHPDLTLNADSIYEVTINVSPGTYLYQLVRDGDWNHDETNPEKVDNNSGKFNSVLHIPGTQHKAPILLTESFDDESFTLSMMNDPEQLYVYWQNYLLPSAPKCFLPVQAQNRKIVPKVRNPPLLRAGC